MLSLAYKPKKAPTCDYERWAPDIVKRVVKGKPEPEPHTCEPGRVRDWRGQVCKVCLKFNMSLVAAIARH